MDARRIDDALYNEITNDLVEGTLSTKKGECSGMTLYSYDRAYWFSTPISAHKGKQPGADPATMLRDEILAEFQ